LLLPLVGVNVLKVISFSVSIIVLCFRRVIKKSIGDVG
jgi:hypothetical protein